MTPLTTTFRAVARKQSQTLFWRPEYPFTQEELNALGAARDAGHVVTAQKRDGRDFLLLAKVAQGRATGPYTLPVPQGPPEPAPRPPPWLTGALRA